MTLATLRLELKSRLNGVNQKFLSDSRCNTFINRAYHSICEAEDWPWLRTTTSGSAPLTISDLRSIFTVVDSTKDAPLTGIDERTLIEHLDADLTTTGTPDYYYRTADSTLAVYPANTSHTLKVTYLKVPTDLSADADTPVIPARYHIAIVDGAECHARKDNGSYEAVAACEAAFERAIQRMRETYIWDHFTNQFQVANWQDY